MKMLVKVLGGSTAYALNTPESDIDYRGIFVNTEPSKILGLEKLDHIQKQETDDIVYYEVRKFFELLRQGNTGALEILFTENNPLENTLEFQSWIRGNKKHFIDTDKMYRCLLGYMQGERRLANGERTGQLGGKRKAQLDKYGFSPKNFVQLFRLAECGVALFETGNFPVNLEVYNLKFRDELLDIKVNPVKYSKEELNARVDAAEAKLKAAYETRKVKSVFNLELANDVLRKIYLPYLMG
jgi:predicted nucleotidyltransferase